MKITSLNIPKARTGKPEIVMAPLIDIIFLLLIFFMVTTVFPENTGLTIEKPESQQSGQLIKNQLIIMVNEQNQIFYKDTPITTDDLKRILEEAYQVQPDNLLLIKADRRTTTQALITVMDAGKKAGAKQMGIATHDKTALP